MRSSSSFPPSLLLPLLLHHEHLLLVRAKHHPFGYQSDSTRSAEYPASPDPSSYAGSVHYDPHHHALYVTGATFGSGVFDGADDEGRPRTGDGTGMDLLTGLELLDVGVPQHSPTTGDCFYGVLGLPREPPDDDPEEEGKDGGEEARLLHARRFGSSGAQEACSALDVGFAGVPEGNGVRLLLAGHVASPSRTAGYIVDDLPAGDYDERGVYAFAQRVDVRLPSHLCANVPDWEGAGTIQQDGSTPGPPSRAGGCDEGVASGVTSRALLGVAPPSDPEAVYPVALATDPTNADHFYVAILAAENRDLDAAPLSAGEAGTLNMDPTLGAGGMKGPGRPDDGRGYRIIVNKVALLSRSANQADQVPSGIGGVGDPLHDMSTVWTEEFEPDGREDVRPSGMLYAPSGDPDGAGDVLILAGTTAGRGAAFGTDRDGGATAEDRQDLDGFVTKILTDKGEFAGHDKFDTETNQFVQTYSRRIQSNPGRDEVVAGLCARPLPEVGRPSDATTHVYVVGSTGGVLPGIPPGTRSDAVFQRYTGYVGSATPTEAFLTKIEVDTMKILWTVQVGAIVKEGERRGSAAGYGCAVTPDGEEVYLTGTVDATGVVTDFSRGDGSDRDAAGGTDVFVASYRAGDGARVFLTQLGSARDDVPSRGRGGVATDAAGNAIVTGSTRGSLLRRRDADEFRYGPQGEEAAADLFVLSLERGTGAYHPSVGVNSNAALASMTMKPVIPELDEALSLQGLTSLQVRVIVAASLILAAASVYAVVLYKTMRPKNKERGVLMDSNLHSRQHWGMTLPSRRRKRRGLGGQHVITDEFNTLSNAANNLNIAIEVRKSSTGGYHGVYDLEQVDFVSLQNSSSNGRGNTAAGTDEVVEGFGLAEEELQQIEGGLDEDYNIGEMDDMTDEDLIKAYNDAMALDIDPESDDVEFMMQGLGSGGEVTEDLPSLT